MWPCVCYDEDGDVVLVDPVPESSQYHVGLPGALELAYIRDVVDDDDRSVDVEEGVLDAVEDG